MGLVFYLSLVIIVDGFFNTGIFLPGVEKGSIRYSELCGFFLLINRSPPCPQQNFRRIVFFLVVTYFALLFISALRSEPMMTGIFAFRGLIISQMLAFFVATRGLGSPEDYRRFFRYLIVLVIFVGLFVFWDVFFDRWLLKSDALFSAEYYVNRKHGRFGSFFLNPNYLGAFVVLIFPVIFVLTINEPWSWLRSLLAWTGLLVLVFCLVETQSRAPLLAFGIEFLILIFGPCGQLSKKRRLSILGILILILTLLMPGFFEHASDRFNVLDQETETEGRTRKTIWLWAERIIITHPFSGIGFGEQQFLNALDTLGYRDQFGEAPLDNPHNSYLQIAVYAGIPALGVFIIVNGILLGRAIRISFRRLAKGNIPSVEKNIPIVFGLSTGIVGFLACVYPDMHLFTRTVAPIYWVFFGLLLSLVTKMSEANPASM